MVEKRKEEMTLLGAERKEAPYDVCGLQMWMCAAAVARKRFKEPGQVDIF